MSFFNKLFDKFLNAGSSDLKYYITKNRIEDISERWTYTKLWIKVDFDRAKKHTENTLIYGYKTFARHYGDFCILNERSYFTTADEAFGDITRQVYDLSELIENGYVIAEKYSHQSTTQYFFWDFQTKSWSEIDNKSFNQYLST